MSFGKSVRAVIRASTCLAIAALSGPVWAQSSESFYAKKPLKILVGTDVGGSYDLMGRLMSRHISRHLPGHPSVMVENMPGGGSMVASNYLYNVAPQDGSVLGVVVAGILLNALFKDDVVRFDPAKFQWIGNAMNDVTVVTIFHTSPYTTLADLKQHEVTMGAGGISSFDATNVLMLNALIGTKFHIVQGYKGGEDLNLAIERGEINGRGGQAWSAWKAIRPEWIAEDKLVPLVQLGLKPLADPKLKDVPLLVDLVKNDDEAYKLAHAFCVVLSLGRPMVMGPGVPADRVAAIRKAFTDTVADPAFREDAARQHVDIGGIDGEEMQSEVASILALDAKMVQRLQDIVHKQK
jgi:tripartite-type tricarboxylate transporter receptor subunit TctC